MAEPLNLTSTAELGDYIELYDLDCTGLGGEFYRFTSNSFSNDVVFWQGNEYVPLPIESRGWDKPGTAGAPPRPILRLSNASRILLPAIQTLGDLVNARLTRWRTFTRYLDGQPDADPTCYFAPTTYYVQQKKELTKDYVEWQLGSYLDREGIRLPREQVLRDVNAPGVGLYRQR